LASGSSFSVILSFLRGQNEKDRKDRPHAIKPQPLPARPASGKSTANSTAWSSDFGTWTRHNAPEAYAKTLPAAGGLMRPREHLTASLFAFSATEQ
jgi:hypothetical protein